MFYIDSKLDKFQFMRKDDYNYILKRVFILYRILEVRSIESTESKFNIYVFDTIRMIILCCLVIKCDFRIMTSLKVEASLQRMYHVF